MKALVVGCGSIGRRHINNLVKLKQVKAISVYTKINHCPEFLDRSKGKIKIIKNLKDIDSDFAIICNQTGKHLDTALLLAKKGINLFIEKPVSHNLKRIQTLKQIKERKKIKLFVGYNLRFLGAIRYLKEQLAKKIIGDLYFAKIEAGQYLPQWRKNIDYRKSYSASRAQGGGVALDLSHEIDYMRYLFSNPITWKVLSARVSNLEIDSDDIFEGLYLYNNFICHVHLDYLQLKKKRQIHIFGSNGYIECDFIKKQLKIKKNNAGLEIINNKNYFDIDKTYVDELAYFLKALRNNSEPINNLDDSIWVLKLIKEPNV